MAPNHKFFDVTIEGVTDPARAATVTVFTLLLTHMGSEQTQLT
jgi:hypothetical protein